ncbi:MAG: DUF421 domain-containing protein [Chloroflexi bacterium]|nr:MAG: DUF421 domain-containing protein [Chloroflexota bacterium]
MDAILRSLAIYIFLLFIFRISGKRSLSQITTFDFVLLLIIGEATQQALLGNDFSLTNSFIVITTLLAADVGLSVLKQRFSSLDKVVDSVPLVIVEDGKLLKDRMERSRIDVSDILSKARELQGLERLDQIKYAVLERSGGITVIPKEQG